MTKLSQDIVDFSQAQKPDFKLRYHGSVSVLQPLNDEAQDWVRGNLQVESWQRIGRAGGVALDTHFVSEIVEAIIQDGLLV